MSATRLEKELVAAYRTPGDPARIVTHNAQDASWARRCLPNTNGGRKSGVLAIHTPQTGIACVREGDKMFGARFS
jgi:hypothetical protein